MSMYLVRQHVDFAFHLEARLFLYFGLLPQQLQLEVSYLLTETLITY
jgi:hypothetical protein